MKDDFALDIVQVVQFRYYKLQPKAIFIYQSPGKIYTYTIFPIIIFGEQFQERVLVYDLNK